VLLCCERHGQRAHPPARRLTAESVAQVCVPREALIGPGEPKSSHRTDTHVTERTDCADRLKASIARPRAGTRYSHGLAPSVVHRTTARRPVFAAPDQHDGDRSMRAIRRCSLQVRVPTRWLRQCSFQSRTLALQARVVGVRHPASHGAGRNVTVAGRARSADLSQACRDASATEPLPSTFGSAGVPAIADRVGWAWTYRRCWRIVDRRGSVHLGPSTAILARASIGWPDGPWRRHRVMVSRMRWISCRVIGSPRNSFTRAVLRARS
jgi:hypothetical protein